jgi:signal transduction histidine kinase
MILIAYHIILFVFTRETSYVFYVAYMCGVLFYTATFNGFTAQYILPEGGMPLQYAMIFSLSLAFIGLVLFTRIFLNTAGIAPRFDIALRLLTAYLLIVSASAIFANYLTVNIVLSSSILPVVAICYSAAISVTWRLRSRQHLYFLVGSFWLMLAGCIASLMTMGILPNNSLTRNSVQIGAIIESVLFALALSHRYKVLQQEKKRTQEENFHLIRDANESLKSAVEERTAELQEKNTDLGAANEEIQRQMEIQTDQAREIELANTTLQEQNEKLNALDHEKNEIIGIVAHDLKNPIIAIHGLAELVQSGFAEPEQIPEITSQIVHTANRMLELVRNLLDVNRLESGTVQFHPVEFDLAPMAESTVWQYTQTASVKHITLHYRLETDVSMVYADEQATMQVLENLVSNAVKYSPHGKQVFIRISSKDDYVRLEVEDEGPGLSDEDKSKLFSKFARLSARPTGGEYSTGLGLSIVKKMVVAMNGKVWCESEYGKGATFIVELPSPSSSTLFHP